jgi:hypothetical protein
MTPAKQVVFRDDRRIPEKTLNEVLRKNIWYYNIIVLPLYSKSNKPGDRDI